jgi:ABC-type ATPase with predicted acetyltransferase domain
LSKTASDYRAYLERLEEMYKAGRIEESVYRTLRVEYEIEFARKTLSEEYRNDAQAESSSESSTELRAVKCLRCGTSIEFNYKPPFRCKRCGSVL